jgi:hypothetical protein
MSNLKFNNMFKNRFFLRKVATVVAYLAVFTFGGCKKEIDPPKPPPPLEIDYILSPNVIVIGDEWNPCINGIVTTNKISLSSSQGLCQCRKI